MMLVRQPSEQALPAMLGARGQFDFAFVDGNHRFDWGAIFVDDYQLPAIEKPIAFFTSHRGWSLEATSSDDESHGWAVVRTANPTDTGEFTDFTDF